ncbi:uncharacterized protein LOC133193807 [Saccostrea echinata]|uniref:uncharacterized protein LOC133193807 n=1 Tax=Saccostrea echinata TaxID=191078 RepID=UPI002A80E458|nr:uncharacterized protein LOC133193807 [Saccostrea echinata]
MSFNMASASRPRDLQQIVRDGLSTLVFAFGHKVGIIETLIKLQSPCSAEELSQKTGKKLRYIQEWLGCLISAGIVLIHEDGKYSLPYDESVVKECCNIAAVLPILTEMIPRLENVMSEEGPRGYGCYEPFLHWWGHFFTPEAIQRWMKDMLIPVLELKQGSQFSLLDLGCGYGKFTLEIAKLYPESSIYGVDMDQVSIDHAQKELKKDEKNNVQFICMRGGDLPKDWTKKFDFVLINDVLHDSFEVDAMLEETKRILKPDGYGAAYDPPISSYPHKLVNDPTAQMELPLSLFSCLPLSLSGPSGDGLGVGWGYERKKKTIEEHGFQLIQIGDKDINTIQERVVFKKNSNN